MTPHAELAEIAARSYAGPQSQIVALDVDIDYVPRGNELVVAFPGTHPANLLDWLRDLRAAPDWFEGLGPLHAGFGSGGVAAWAKVRVNVAKERRRIVYTGHSLGGAVAQVAAACHARAGFAPCRVVTFGAPRVPVALNPIFGSLVRSALEAVEYQRAGDIVPDVPMRPLYVHPTRPKQIGVPVDGLSAADVAANVLKLPDAIAGNHSIARYAADLKALGL